MVEDKSSDAPLRTRMDRAMHIRNILVRLINEQGEWEWPDESDRGPNRLCGSLSRPGWSALLSTPLPDDSCVEAALDQTEGGLVLFDGGEDSLDVWVDGVGKVLSVRVTDEDEELVRMVPGPWEMEFGLPERGWPPGVARRIAATLARDTRLAA